MVALRVHATLRKHPNVLHHMVGFFKDRLDTAALRELQNLVAHYRSGLVPLVVPLTLIRHYLAKYEIAYLVDQVYLAPHPRELMLHTHVLAS